MSQMRDRMRSGLPYKADDPDLRVDYMRAQHLLAAFNASRPDEVHERAVLLHRLMGSCGPKVTVTPPLRCDYGQYIHLGERTFLNYDCILLDVRTIQIGARCQFGPRVQILTATHPLDPTERAEGWEAGEPVTVGDDVWIGGGAIVLPGVTIGDGSVIGAGSVVTGDVPPHAVAVGNPARVIRQLGR